MINNKISLTGIKPTGTPHLGNYVGAIKPIIDMSFSAKQTYIFIADLHALNSVKDAVLIEENTYEIAATFIALGIDLKKVILFRQSDVPEVYQLATFLNNITPKGLMNKAHAYKASVDKNRERGEPDDVGVNMGLFNYPILMAADILLYKADVVPVGQDQKQHVEFARDIAESFNYNYKKDLLIVPEPIIQKEANSIPGLDGRKMSKSYNNYIKIFEEPGKMKKLISRIVTDSKAPDDIKDPEASTIFQLYQNFSSEADTKLMRDKFLNGKIGYGDAKKELYQAISDKFQEPRKIYYELMANKSKIDECLNQGSRAARIAANNTIIEVSKAMLGRQIYNYLEDSQEGK